MKKLRIFLLTLLMVFTILPINTIAEGEDNSSKEPDVSVYATKTQLMDDTFAPKSGGTANNIGKIIFGKNSSGDSLEWYILGADSGVNEGKNNTVIFTQSAITTNQAFENDMNTNKTYQSNFGTYSVAPLEVYPNHYGASDIRDALKDIATSTSYFTSSEQSIMNFTTISTQDVGSYVYYENSDKLYLPYVYYNDLYVIRVGSDNKKELNYVFYYWENYDFWLRSGRDDNPTIAWYLAGETISAYSVNMDYAVRPAANLDLTNVLFASAAKAGLIDKLPSGAAMTLRFKDNNLNIGTVAYNLINGNIKATNNLSDSNKVYLVVQGKDPNITEDNQNWYYSIEITGTKTLNISKIKEDLNLVSDIDLAQCKIWLETTGNDGLIYATNSIGTYDIDYIENVEIKDIEKPYVNGIPDTSATCTTEGVSNTTPLVSWKPNHNPFGYYTEYTASVTLSAANGYAFADTVNATIIDGISYDANVVKNSDGTLTVEYTFPYTQDKVINVTNPDTLTFENGTSLEDIKDKLPTKVNIKTESGREMKLPVSWNPNADLFTNYDPNKKEEQKFYVVGPVTLDDTFVFDDAVPSATLYVIVKAVAFATPTPTSAYITTITDDGYVVPNTGVK